MDNFEAEFSWPSDDASNVILTGSFDNWSCSIHLPKGASGFAQRVCVPWDEKVPYKFIVDGRWVTRDDCPTEFDGAGNLNNVLLTPSKPATSTMDHQPTPAPLQVPSESMPSTTTSSEASPLYSETPQQEASKAAEDHRIIESGPIDTISAVVEVVLAKEPALNVPDVVVEAAEVAESSVEGDSFSATVDTAAAPVSDVGEEIATTPSNICGVTNSGPECILPNDSINPSMPSDLTDNILEGTEQPAATLLPEIPAIVADDIQGSSDVTPQMAPIVHIAILPVNDHTLNEPAAPSIVGEIVAHDPSISDVAASAQELSTHSPMQLSKALPPASQDEAQGVLDQDSKPTQEETSVAHENGELPADATPDLDTNGITQTITVNANPVDAIATSDANAGPVILQNEPPSLAPEPQDACAVTTSSISSTPAPDGDTKAKDVLFASSTTPNSPVTTSTKLKKRRSLIAKVKSFFSIKEKRKK